MTKEREQFDKWWENFKDAHEEWKFADREALLLAAYRQGQRDFGELVIDQMKYTDVFWKKVLRDDICKVLEDLTVSQGQSNESTI
jgi:hypothetical protein